MYDASSAGPLCPRQQVLCPQAKYMTAQQQHNRPKQSLGLNYRHMPAGASPLAVAGGGAAPSSVKPSGCASSSHSSCGSSHKLLQYTGLLGFWGFQAFGGAPPRPTPPAAAHTSTMIFSWGHSENQQRHMPSRPYLNVFNRISMQGACHVGSMPCRLQGTARRWWPGARHARVCAQQTQSATQGRAPGNTMHQLHIRARELA